MGDGITYGDALFKVGKKIMGDKFAGIFDENAMDRIDLKPGTGALINKPKNQHWISQYVDFGGKLHTFDSYGRKMGPNPVKTKDFKQVGDEKNCGPRSLAYLYKQLQGGAHPKLKAAAITAGTLAGLWALDVLASFINREK